jgi:hypothetical protein
MKSSNYYNLLKPAAYFILVIGSIIPVLNYFRQTDISIFVARISSIGLPVIFIFIPYLIITISDTMGWKNSFGNNKLHIPIKKLYILRLATEALQASLPWGAVYAEVARPFLLKKHLNLKYTESIPADIITKINILIAQIIFLLCGLFIIISEYKKNLSSFTYLSESVLYLTSAVLTLSVILFSYFLFCKNLLLHIINLLGKINLRVVRQLLIKCRPSFIEINHTLNSFYKEHKKKLLLTLMFFLFTWILMALESLIILKIIGIEVNIFQMIALESLISFVRMVFFFLPGAAGPLDLSIIMIFNLVGIQDPLQSSLMYIVLKRSKEVCWIITGYFVLIVLGVEITKLSRYKRSEPQFIS